MFPTISPLKSMFVQRLTVDLTAQNCKQHQMNPGLLQNPQGVYQSVYDSVSFRVHFWSSPNLFIDKGKYRNFNQQCHVFEAF